MNRQMSGQKKSGDLKVRDFHVKLDAGEVSTSGKFKGYGSIFGNVDRYQEVVEPGAFAESIKEISATGRPLPVLWNHNSSEPLGGYDLLKEDERGLYVEGHLLVEAVSRAKEVAALIDAKVVSGLSIGYYIRNAGRDEETGIYHLRELSLREISLCTFPANDEARLETIKMKLAHGSMPSAREFERILRDAGFSKSLSARIAAKGYGAIGKGDPVEPDAALRALRDISARFS